MTGDNKTRIVSSGKRKILSEDKVYGVGLQLNLDWIVWVSVTQNLDTANLFNDNT